MRSFLKSLCAGTLAASMALAGIVPAAAVPFRAAQAQTDQSNVIQVQSRREMRQDRRQFRREMRQDRRQYRREVRRDRRAFERRGNSYYYHGHRGYRHYRPGYRQYNGWWFPPAAFVAGAIIGGAISGSTSRSNAHVQWCANRYRSYRVSDDTFQPYHGPRQRCVSPY